VAKSSPSHVLGSQEQLTALIEQEIATLGLRPGSKLPTEREWAARTGLTRAAVRSTLAALERQGRIVREVGRGTFLSAHAATVDEGAAAAGGSSPAEIMAVRLLVEPASMPLVVTAARPADFDEMDRCLDAAEHNPSYEAFEKWDAAYHRSLAAATHNSLLLQICDMANAARHQPVWGRLKRRNFTQERRLQYIEDHRTIAEALKDRDGPAAQAAMRTHLLRVRAIMLGDV
jgi:DNA-binding FadR family transcriptional regulator